jgi:hypothetical protein
LTDFQPLAGSRRRGYLLLTTSVAFVGMTSLYFLPLDPTMAVPLLLWLSIPAIGAFLFLWNFNPFSATVLYYYSTATLQFSEQFVGTLTSWQAVGGIIGCAAYTVICRRIPVPWLIHGSIAAGIVATLAYWAYRDPTSGVIVSVLVGVVYAIGTVISSIWRPASVVRKPRLRRLPC